MKYLKSIPRHMLDKICKSTGKSRERVVALALEDYLAKVDVLEEDKNFVLEEMAEEKYYGKRFDPRIPLLKE